jgi:hypothetical protein
VRLHRVLIVAGLAFAAPRAGAQTVYNGGAPNGGAGWNIFDDNQAATSFWTPAQLTFDAIRFWGLLPQSTPYAADIFWTIMSDAGGTPGSIVASGDAVATSVLRTGVGAGFFSLQFDLALAAPQTLGAGEFWLALHDGPLDPSAFTGSSLLWETTDAPGTFDIQTFTVDPTWVAGADQGLAFELRTTATPEPATFLLAATGLLLVVAVRRSQSVKEK